MVKRVIALFPDGDLAPVEDFRRRWDPLAGAVPAHITLAYPFDDERTVEELTRDLQSVARTFSPSTWRASTIATEDSQYLFLLPDVVGNELVQRLHEAIYAGPLVAAARPERFLPHMTVARTRERALLLAAERAAHDVRLALVAEVTTLSAYRIDGEKRVREVDCPLGVPHS